MEQREPMLFLSLLLGYNTTAIKSLTLWPFKQLLRHLTALWIPPPPCFRFSHTVLAPVFTFILSYSVILNYFFFRMFLFSLSLNNRKTTDNTREQHKHKFFPQRPSDLIYMRPLLCSPILKELYHHFMHIR